MGFTYLACQYKKTPNFNDCIRRPSCRSWTLDEHLIKVHVLSAGGLDMDSLRAVIMVAFLSAFADITCYGTDGTLIRTVSRVEPNRQPAAGTAPHVTGTVEMMQKVSGGPTFIKVDLKSVGQPFQQHAIHIHDYGDIYTRGCKSAGGHFNPLKSKDEMGNLGKLTTDSAGNIHQSFLSPRVSLVGPHSVIGRSFVIHGATASKPQIGCGVIFLAPVVL